MTDGYCNCNQCTESNTTVVANAATGDDGETRDKMININKAGCPPPALLVLSTNQH